MHRHALIRDNFRFDHESQSGLLTLERPSKLFDDVVTFKELPSAKHSTFRYVCPLKFVKLINLIIIARQIS